jgi:hypothetical protein
MKEVARRGKEVACWRDESRCATTSRAECGHPATFRFFLDRSFTVCEYRVTFFSIWPFTTADIFCIAIDVTWITDSRQRTLVPPHRMS